MGDAELTRAAPWCCYICGLHSHQFPDDFLRNVKNSGSTVVEYVPQNVQQLIRQFSKTDVKVMHTMAQEIGNLHYPIPPPMTHLRYYQEDVVSTGLAGLDARLGGRLERESIYCFYEDTRNRFGLENLLRNILENAQRKVDKPGTVPGMENAMQYGLVFNTNDEEPEYMYPLVGWVLYMHSVNMENGMMDEERLNIDIGLLRRENVPGVIVVDTPRGVDEPIFRANDPLLELWLMKLQSKYGRLDDKILVFLVDKSLINENALAARKRLFLRYCLNNNITMIDMVHEDSERWEVEHFDPREPY